MLNSLTTYKQSIKFSSADLQKKILSPSCIILRIQRLKDKQCRSRWGGSSWATSSRSTQLFSSLLLKELNGCNLSPASLFLRHLSMFRNIVTARNIRPLPPSTIDKTHSTWCRNDVVSTSMWWHYVESESIWRYVYAGHSNFVITKNSLRFSAWTVKNKNNK